MSEFVPSRTQTPYNMKGSPRSLHEMNNPQGHPPRRSGSSSELAMSRINEKKHLGHLNDRLAAYIERVRQLENQNYQLQVYIRRVEDELKTKDTEARVNFEAELQRIYDTLGADNKKLAAENEALRAENSRLKQRIPELQQFNHESEKARIKAETELRDLSAKVKGLEDEKNLWEQEATNIQTENLSLHRKRQELEDMLAQERALRAEAEKRLADLLKEFDKFKAEHDRIVEYQKKEYLEKLEATRQELHGEHEAELKEALDKLRRELTEQLLESRKPLQEMYEKKLALLTEDLDNFRRTAGDANAQLQKVFMQLNTIEQERSSLLEKVKVLESDNGKLQNELRSTYAKYDALVQQADAERKALEREIEDLMQQYADALDAKVHLHAEIAAYQRLLESEENRLHMHQQQLSQQLQQYQQRPRTPQASSTHSTPRVIHRGMKQQITSDV